MLNVFFWLKVTVLLPSGQNMNTANLHVLSNVADGPQAILEPVAQVRVLLNCSPHPQIHHNGLKMDFRVVKSEPALIHEILCVKKTVVLLCRIFEQPNISNLLIYFAVCLFSLFLYFFVFAIPGTDGCFSPFHDECGRLCRQSSCGNRLHGGFGRRR